MDKTSPPFFVGVPVVISNTPELAIGVTMHDLVTWFIT